MGKSSVYDVRLGNAKNQFVGTDSRGSAGLRYLPFIGDGVELTQLGENVFRKVQRFQNTLAAGIFLWNQPVCAKVLDFLDVSQLAAASRRIEQAPHLLHSGNAFSHHEIQRRPSSE